MLSAPHVRAAGAQWPSLIEFGGLCTLASSARLDQTLSPCRSLNTTQVGLAHLILDGANRQALRRSRWTSNSNRRGKNEAYKILADAAVCCANTAGGTVIIRLKRPGAVEAHAFTVASCWRTHRVTCPICALVSPRERSTRMASVGDGSTIPPTHRCHGWWKV